MDKENKNYDDDQDYHDEYVDDFEIGIPIEDTLNTLTETETTDQEAEQEPDQKSDLETYRETGLETETASPEEETGLETAAVSPFEEIQAQLQYLSQAFDSKLKYDEHKNKVIDDLHQSLQEHREGLVKKYLHRIITDIIKIVDDIRKFASHYKKQPPTDETTEKLLIYIEHVASDLEDLFAWEGVMPFTCEGDQIDPSRQRILNRIETDDPEKDKTVAERLRPGYEWDGKIIRPEMVSAYIYQTESTEEENNNE